jgi:hypothetical protein
MPGAAVGGVVLVAALAGCGSPAQHAAVRAATVPVARAAPAEVTPSPVITAPIPAPATTSAPTPAATPMVSTPTQATAPAPRVSHPAATAAPVGTHFAPVVDSAMGTFTSAVGLEAPATLPTAPAAISAQATQLGGTDSVTLVATSSPLPVNDPSLPSTPGTDLGTFTTTATSSPAAASGNVASQATDALAVCSSTPSTPVTVDGATSATTCPSAMGTLVQWTDGTWQVQVLDTTAAASPQAGSAGAGTADPGVTAVGDQVAGWIATHRLPTATAGFVDVIVGAGTPSSALTWAEGADVYQTRSGQGATAAAGLAASMVPWG